LGSRIGLKNGHFSKLSESAYLPSADRFLHDQTFAGPSLDNKQSFAAQKFKKKLCHALIIGVDVGIGG
jgi:hypothetical protein